MNILEHHPQIKPIFCYCVCTLKSFNTTLYNISSMVQSPIVTDFIDNILSHIF